jgi:hypothetical protein
VPQPNENQKHGSQDKPHPNGWRGYFGSADFWTALATIFLVMVGIWGVVETRHALELSQRATISTIGVQMTKSPPEKNEGIKFAVLVMNTGKDPAIDVVFAFHVTTIDSYDPAFTSMSNISVSANTTCAGLQPKPGRAVLAPTLSGTIHGWSYDTIHAVPPFRTDDRILDGSKFAVIQGCAAYNTVNQAHHSAFCYILETRLAEDKSRTWNFAGCAGGFDMD